VIYRMGFLKQLTLPQIGRAEDGLAWSEPFEALSVQAVTDLQQEALILDNEIGFSREHPSRLRGVHHLSSCFREIMDNSTILPTISEYLHEELSIHPSAHFGCTFNWTRQSLDGFADSWHLDAAPLTLLILLSTPIQDYRGGELLACIDQPEFLWERRQHGNPIPTSSIRDIGPRFPGEAVLLNGRRVAHAVAPVLPGKLGFGRLTLAMGLFSAKNPRISMFRNRIPTQSELKHCWIVENEKSRILATLEQTRRSLKWIED